MLCCPTSDWCVDHGYPTWRTRDWLRQVAVTVTAQEMTILTLINIAYWQGQTYRAPKVFLHLFYLQHVNHPLHHPILFFDIIRWGRTPLLFQAFPWCIFGIWWSCSRGLGGSLCGRLWQSPLSSCPILLCGTQIWPRPDHFSVFESWVLQVHFSKWGQGMGSTGFPHHWHRLYRNITSFVPWLASNFGGK